MIVYPNAKINIGLFVTGKRDDGFHNLETVFYPISLRDTLEINRTEGSKGEYFLETSGLLMNCSANSNLVVKAYKLLALAYDLPAIKIHLHKEIPSGAGLGGGSSDAAYMLRALNTYFRLQISEEGLCKYAARLGSDCSFFIQNLPAFAQGRGELLETIDFSLNDYTIVFAKPDCEVSTAEAYAGVTPHEATYDLRQLVTLPLGEWQKNIKNDFEETVFLKYPKIQRVKESMYKRGALYASLTGSGSGVFGIFKKGTASVAITDGDFVWNEEE